MVFGIIYGYFCGSQCVYVGKTIGTNKLAAKVLARRHAGHLRGHLTQLDKAIRRKPTAHTVHMLETRQGVTIGSLRREINALELSIIKALRPLYNRTGLHPNVPTP